MTGHIPNSTMHLPYPTITYSHYLRDPPHPTPSSHNHRTPYLPQTPNSPLQIPHPTHPPDSNTHITTAPSRTHLTHPPHSTHIRNLTQPLHPTHITQPTHPTRPTPSHTHPTLSSLPPSHQTYPKRSLHHTPIWHNLSTPFYYNHTHPVPATPHPP